MREHFGKACQRNDSNSEGIPHVRSVQSQWRPQLWQTSKRTRLCRAPIQPSGLDHSSMLTTSKSSSIAARFVQTRQGLALHDCHFQLAAKLAAAIAAQSWHTSQRHTLLEKCPVRKLCLCFLVDDFCPPLGSLALGAINSRLLATLRLSKMGGSVGQEFRKCFSHETQNRF